MPQGIDRYQVQEMLAEGAQLVEVLPEEDYESWHLPGAINIPLKEFNQAAIAQLDKHRPVIVYCADTQWDMSPRAAWRLESLLFDRVYDYVVGKNDWLSAGFPIEGEMAEHHHVLANDAVRRDLPTCQYTDRLAHVSDLLVEPGQVECVVLNGEGIVLGRLPKKAFDHPGDTLVEQIMEPGPTTFRPGTPLGELTERMKKAQVDNVLITTAEGKFLGVLYLEDAERELARASVPGARV